MTLRRSTYGKGRVRILRLARGADGAHIPRELTLRIMLTGRFDRAWTDADNRTTIATDTIRNVANVVAREHLDDECETFCEALAARYLALYDSVATVTVDAEETRWRRLTSEGAAAPHPHAFLLDGNGRDTVHSVATRETIETRSGIAGLTFMKTTGSGWAGFVRDRYTTLPETDDRIAATSMVADWSWRDRPARFAAARATLCEVMLRVFADTWSASIQDSLYRMGRAALEAVPELGDIALACPNKHYILANLAPFGLDNPNAVFVPTDEPHGQIECVVGR